LSLAVIAATTVFLRVATVLRRVETAVRIRRIAGRHVEAVHHMSVSEIPSSAPQEHAASDDAVHFNQAAKALGVSRKTVERMVKRGELERDTSRDTAGQEALVTKRSLVAALERRRGEPADMSRLAHDLSKASAPPNLGQDLRALVEPLMQQVIDARSEAAELESQVRLLEERVQSTREEGELLATFVAGSWRERRQARKAAIARLAQRS
jgi:hypothetical protein